jgi:hypothetical protein
MRQKNSAMKFNGDTPNAIRVKCDVCGESSKTPLLTMVFLESETEKYYACPRCLSRTANIYAKQISKDFEKLEDNLIDHEEFAISNASNSEVPKRCVYNLGYLKNRIKNSPIPEECLTCSKMIECMY